MGRAEMGGMGNEELILHETSPLGTANRKQNKTRFVSLQTLYDYSVAHPFYKHQKETAFGNFTLKC